MRRPPADALARGLASAIALSWASGHALAQPAPEGSRGSPGLSEALRLRTTQAPAPASTSPILDDFFMLAPNVPRTAPKLGLPRGWRLGEWEVRIRNRGDVPLNFAVMDEGRACAEGAVDPGIEVLLLPCGGQLAWHDGRSVRTIALSRGGRYEMSWGDGRWVVAPLRP